MSDICAICHEDLSANSYNLPECSHKFHINCIMTWFRAGHNSCPLCNNAGVNSVNDISYHSWWDKRVALENYKICRRKYRRKDCPIDLKKKIDRLKKYEEKYKKIKKEIKDFNNSKPQEITVREIKKKEDNLRRKRWKLEHNIRKQKIFIGLSEQRTKIIIPIKQYV